MRKAFILCAVFSCTAVLSACTGDGGDTETTGDAVAAPEAVLPSEAGETDAWETALPVAPDLPVQYSPDGQSALTTEDTDAEQLCGLVHEYYFNSDRKKCANQYGFTIDDVGERDWEGNAAFSMKSVYGTDGADAVEDFEEEVEYTETGKPDSYRSQGLWEHRRNEDGALEQVAVSVLKLDYVYRDDGTLYYRNYTHDPFLFGTTLCSLESYYDERGRVIYESGYITHGELEYFYIYGDEGEKPQYLLTVDYGGGYAVPDMKRYR